MAAHNIQLSQINPAQDKDLTIAHLRHEIEQLRLQVDANAPHVQRTASIEAAVAPGAIIYQLPRGLKQKHIALLKKKLPNGVTLERTKDQKIYFRDSRNKTTSWLPPNMSQQELRTFVSTCVSVANLQEASSADASNEKAPEDEQPFLDTIVPRAVQEMFFSLLTLASNAFKVVMATLLAVFVPQTCPPSPTNPEKHDCTMEENFTDLTSFNKVALAFNFIALGFILLMFYIVWIREKFLVLFLESSPSVAADNLRKSIKPYPFIEKRLVFLNTTLFRVSTFCVILAIINAVLSAILVFRDYYAGPRSVTVWITNAALLVQVLTTAIQNSYIGMQTMDALSCVELVPVQFNALDPVFLSDPKPLMDEVSKDYCLGNVDV